MRHESRQYEIPARHLLVAKRKRRADSSTDIGNAKVTFTIFGGSKVRVIRKKDRLRRAWLLAALAMTATFAAAWLGWTTLKYYERMKSEIPPVILPSVSNIPSTVPSIGDGKPAASLESELQRSPVLKSSDSLAERPIAAQSLVKSKPQPKPQDTQIKAAQSQNDLQKSSVPSATVRPPVPTAKADPAPQPAAGKPMDVVPVVEKKIEKETSIISPEGNDQPADPVDVQPRPLP